MKKADKVINKLRQSGIAVSQLEDSKNKITKERIVYCLSNALVIFLFVYGLTGFFLNAFDLPHNSFKLMVFTAFLSVYLSFFYLNTLCFNLGYIFLLFYVIYYTIRNFMKAGSGANAIANLIIVAIDKELNLTVLREFNEMYSNRYESITSCMIIITIFIACIMNIWISRRMSIGNPIILALLVVEFSIYLNDEFSFFHLVLILAGFTFFILFRQNNEIPAEYRKKQKSFTYKKKTIRLKKRSNELKGNLVSTAVFVCVTLIISAIAFKSLSNTYLNSNSALKDRTDVVVRNVAMFGFSALFDSGNSTTGGMNNGTFGNVDSISFDYQTDLEVTFVPYTSSPIYIPTYYANNYNSSERKWQNTLVGYSGQFEFDGENFSTNNEYYQTYWMLDVMNNGNLFTESFGKINTADATFLIKNLGADEVFPASLYYTDNNNNFNPFSETGSVFQEIKFGEAAYFNSSPLLVDYNELNGFEAYYKVLSSLQNFYYSDPHPDVDTLVLVDDADIENIDELHTFEIYNTILIVCKDIDTLHTILELLTNDMYTMKNDDAENIKYKIENYTEYSAEILRPSSKELDYYLRNIPTDVETEEYPEAGLTTATFPDGSIFLDTTANHYTIFTCNPASASAHSSRMSYNYNFDILTQNDDYEIIMETLQYIDFNTERSIDYIATYLRDMTGYDVFVVKGEIMGDMTDEYFDSLVNSGNNTILGIEQEQEIMTDEDIKIEKFSFNDLRYYVHSNYTDVPSDISERLLEICEEQGFSGNRIQIINQLIDFLAENYTYSYSPGSTPEGEDFALYFLDEQKEGFCVHFATSACLLLRTMGIPAKYVEGYCLDSSNYENAVLFSEIAEEEYADYIVGKNNEYLTDSSLWYSGDSEFSYSDPVTVELTDADAHAWVEVYFEGFGWIPIEFTVGAFSDDSSLGMTNMLGALYSPSSSNNSALNSVNSAGDNITTSITKFFNRGVSNFSGLFALAAIALIIVYKGIITYQLYYSNKYKRNIWQYRFICKLIRNDLIKRYDDNRDSIEQLVMSYNGLRLLMVREYGLSKDNANKALTVLEASSYAPKKEMPDADARLEAFRLITDSIIKKFNGIKRYAYRFLLYWPFKIGSAKLETNKKNN